jgi:hypothetical protein
VFSEYKPGTGRSWAEAVTLWQLMHGGDAGMALADPQAPLTRLGHARFLERKLGLVDALPFYGEALKLAQQSTGVATEIVLIAQLRALHRASTLPQQTLVSADTVAAAWAAVPAALLGGEAFRTQRLAYLIASGQKDAADGLRNEFLASRSAA